MTKKGLFSFNDGDNDDNLIRSKHVVEAIFINVTR
jgi:hypothetical protein